jgi:hypothetical protein
MRCGPARDFLPGCAVGSGDQWSGPPDLRLSFGDASQHTRSFSFLVAAPSHQRDLAASPLRHLRSGQDRDSSLGVVNDRPSVDMHAQRPLPVASSLRRAACSKQAPQGSETHRTRQRPSARRCHAPDSFRPCRSSRLRRFSPLGAVQVCCTLQPTMGFATFRDRWIRASRRGCENLAARPTGGAPSRGSHRPPPLPACLPPLRGGASGSRSSAIGSHGSGSVPGGATPFEAFPSPAAVPRHRDRCPLAVGPSLRLTRSPHSREDVAAGRASAGSSTSGPCSTGESVAPVRRCRRSSARCSHGLSHPPGSRTRAAVATRQRASRRRDAGWSWGRSRGAPFPTRSDLARRTGTGSDPRTPAW